MDNMNQYFFNNEQFTVFIHEGKIAFYAKELCNILELKNHSQAISRLKPDEKGLITVDTLGGPQRKRVVYESGFYTLVFTSRLEKAQEFRYKVTNEILPEIRQTGTYGLDKLTDREKNILLARQVIESEERAIKFEKKAEKLISRVEEMEPKEEYYDTVKASKGCITIAEFSKLLPPGFGELKLFKLLRSEKILMTEPLNMKNKPYQEYIERKWFNVDPRFYEDKEGEQIGYTVTMITEKGQIGIVRILNKKHSGQLMIEGK